MFRTFLQHHIQPNTTPMELTPGLGVDGGNTTSESRKVGLVFKEDSSPAPEYLLKVIRCQCKGYCDSNKRSCKN